MKGWKEVEYEVVCDRADVRVFLRFISVQHLLTSRILSYSEHDYAVTWKLRPSWHAYWRFDCGHTFTNID
jgi:hypothetical protein